MGSGLGEILEGLAREKEKTDWVGRASVEGQIVSGLKYLQVVKRAGLKGQSSLSPGHASC